MGFSNKIVKYIYYKVNFQLESALCISAGEELSDMDVIRDYEGKPYIPASSVVGACRDFLTKVDAKYDKALFGDKNNQGEISRAIFADSYFISDYSTEIRDGIKLDFETGQTEDKAKYDYEVVNPFAKGELLIEVLLREDEKGYEDDLKEALKILYAAFNQGEIRLGTKKTRGLGKIKIDEVKYKEYKSGEAWWDFTDSDLKKVEVNYNLNSTYKKYEVEVELGGGLIIRTYGDIKDDVDYSQMTVLTGNGEMPVITATSLNGMFRHGMTKILIELMESLNLNLDDKLAKAGKMLEEVFGKVEDEGEKKGDSAISKVIIDDVYLEGSSLVKTVRTSINRFDQSVKNGALYSSMPAFGGQTSFVIYFPKEEEYKWAKQLFELALFDINSGYLPLGGETAIGRGIFKVKRVDGKELDFKKYEVPAGELIEKIRGMK